jgi:NAD(P)H dehydrogenase (quinone)
MLRVPAALRAAYRCRMSNLLVLNGHPEPDSFTWRLSDAYTSAARALVDVRRIDLASLHFDPVLRRDHGQLPLEHDLMDAADALTWAEHVVWLFPTWWSGPPALVKGFLDRLLTPGFAFRYRGESELPEKLLRGRSARFITSMDSPRYWYWLGQGRALHTAFVRGTLGFVGFAPVRCTTFYRARFLSEAQRTQAVCEVAHAARHDARALARRSRVHDLHAACTA